MQLADVTQRMLERYEDALARLASEAEEQRSAARFNRCLLEAAVVAGIAEELPADLLDLLPWQIVAYSEELAAHIAAAKAPPDPN
jgi:hypothetical protein